MVIMGIILLSAMGFAGITVWRRRRKESKEEDVDTTDLNTLETKENEIKQD